MQNKRLPIFALLLLGSLVMGSIKANAQGITGYVEAPTSVSTLDQFAVKLVLFATNVCQLEDFTYTLLNAAQIMFEAHSCYRISVQDSTITIKPNGVGDGHIVFAFFPGTLTSGTETNADTITTTVFYTPPNTRPTVRLTGPAAVKNRNTFVVTATFSEPVTGLLLDEIEVENGMIEVNGIQSSRGDTIYTLQIKPNSNSAIKITIPANKAQDSDGLGNTADALTVGYDATRPEVIAFTGPTSLVTSLANTFDVRVTFSESVMGLQSGDLVITNGTIATNGFRRFSNDGETVYTIQIKPDGKGNIVVTIPENTAQDSASNGNIVNALSTLTVDYDTTQPTVMAFTGPEVVNNLEPFQARATFSKSVQGLKSTDLVITNGDIPTGGFTRHHNGGETVYIIRIKPKSADDIVITIPENKARGPAGNGNIARTLRVPYRDIMPPTVVSLTGPDGNRVYDLEPFDVTVTFSEIVSINTNIQVSNNELAVGTFEDDDVTSGMVYTLTITPNGDGDIVITIPAGAFKDRFENPIATESLTVSYAPLAVESFTGPSSINSLDLFDMTLIFNDLISFASSDIVISNGSIPTSVSPDNVDSYTLSIKPNIADDIVITIPVGAISDSAGNTNLAAFILTVTYDTSVPTVTLTGPDSATKLEPFAVRATFSETVTGLEAAEITLTEGTVTMAGSGAIYTLNITPTGTGNISITIPTGVATDAAGNENTASNTLEIINATLVAETQVAITGFMLDRANHLASNQPGLTRFLQDADCSTLIVNSTDTDTGSLEGCVSSGRLWGELNGSWSDDDDDAYTYTLFTLGGHGVVGDNTLIGGLVQLDAADDEKRNIKGLGWLVGPYFVSNPNGQDVFIEGRLLYGQTDNDITPLGRLPGTYTDSFETERYLTQLRIMGEYGYRRSTLMPLLDLIYIEDVQGLYTDTPGNRIEEQKIYLSQITLGIDFKLPFAMARGSLDLTGGLSGIYSHTNGSVGDTNDRVGDPDFEGGRGRVELGLNYAGKNGGTFTVTTFYDGISTDHESYGVNLGAGMKF